MKIDKNKHPNIYLDLNGNGDIIYVNADTDEELGIYDYRKKEDNDNETAS